MSPPWTALIFWGCIWGVLTAIVAGRKFDDPNAVVFGGFFMGFFLGPIALLALIFIKSEWTQCPHCRSRISRKASVCPRCQMALVPSVGHLERKKDPSRAEDFGGFAVATCEACGRTLSATTVKCPYCFADRVEAVAPPQ